jgi:hypothetical protein
MRQAILKEAEHEKARIIAAAEEKASGCRTRPASSSSSR